MLDDEVLDAAFGCIYRCREDCLAPCLCVVKYIVKYLVYIQATTRSTRSSVPHVVWSEEGGHVRWAWRLGKMV